MIAFIDDHREAHGVEPICKVLPIAPSTYHAHAAKRTDPARLSLRAKRDAALKPEIARVFAENFAVYGVRKVWRQLQRESVDVARCTVARLMQSMGLQGVIRGKPIRTTVSDKSAPCPLDHVNRQFQAPRPNVLWVSDFTYVCDLDRLRLRRLRHRRLCPPHRGLACHHGPRMPASCSMPWSKLSMTGGLFIAAGSCTTATGAAKANSSGGRNALMKGVAMKLRKRRSDRSGRAPLFSPGRPAVAGRDERRRFWAGIAIGLESGDAALAAGVPPAVGTRWFRTAGGISPAMFGRSAKPLSGRYLSFAEREEIAVLRAQGYSMQEVARRLGRAASTISRELRRNAATRSGGLEYRATTAQWHAERAARRPKPGKLAENAALRAYVEERLAGIVVTPSGTLVPGPAVSWKGRRHGRRKDRRWSNAWSPEQIARRTLGRLPGR